MEGFLAELFNMSLTASYLVVVVCLVRFLLSKAPKWIRMILWGMVGIRLLLPIRLESVFSLVPRIMTSQTTDTTGQLNEVVNQTAGGVVQGMPEPEAGAGFVSSVTGVMLQTSPEIPWTGILLAVWAAGAFLMLAYCAFSYMRLSLHMREAVKCNGEGAAVYQSEKVDSPFVLGIVSPRIYIPFSMKEEERQCVIAHEKAHISRKDYLIKPFAFLLLALHWFNPFIWIAYILLCRDIELACDEKAIRVLGEVQKKVYSQALLKCSVSRRSIAVCPVAFGETGVKERIKNVLHYKKPAFWIVAVSLLLCVIVAVCFLTNPRQKKPEKETVQEATDEESTEGLRENEQEESAEQETDEQSVQIKGSETPPMMYLKNAYSSSMDYLEVKYGICDWAGTDEVTGNTVGMGGSGSYPTEAVKDQKRIILSDDKGVPYIADFMFESNVSGLKREADAPDYLTIREWDLLDLGDVSAEPISVALQVENQPIILFPQRIYEIVAEWDETKFEERGFYGIVSYCFATGYVIDDSDKVVFDAVIKDMMVDSEGCICISSKSSEYPGAFVLRIPETVRDKNTLHGGGLFQITARETDEMHNNMKVLEAIEIRMNPINNDPGGAFEPSPGSKVEYEVNTLPDVRLSMNKYKSWEGEVSLRNNAEESYTYGEWFEIQYKYGEEWHRVPYISEFGYYDIAYALPEGESEEIHINWSKIYGELPVGTYRIVKDVIVYRSPGDYDKHYLAAEFEIMPSDE